MDRTVSELCPMVDFASAVLNIQYYQMVTIIGVLSELFEHTTAGWIRTFA
jgi:hypothetical protein